VSDLLPPCTNACPVQTDVRGYLAAIARRDYGEAYRLICANNPFPTVCAWICTHPCEAACRRADIDAPVSIRALKRFAVEAAGLSGAELQRSPATGRKVAVVGGGPSGLTAAYYLARHGHQVVVFDRQHSPGGHLLTSLPGYRLPREMLRRDVEAILAAGVEVRTGLDVGRDVTLCQLKEEYDAVVVGAGHWVGRVLSLPGFDHPSVMMSLPFLTMVNTGQKMDIGKQVVVIGGGDVALDVARTALRLGAPEVRVVCLEPRNLMPARDRSIGHALDEGVILVPGRGPVELLVEDGAITALVVQRVRPAAGPDGKFTPVFEPGQCEIIPCDTIILSIGQGPDYSFLEGSGLAAAAGDFKAGGHNRNMVADGLFSCGELAEGPGPTIAAVASGRRAAEAVQRYLQGEQPGDNGEKLVIGPVPSEIAEKAPRFERQQAPVSPPDQRNKDFLPYEPVLDESAALKEAGRCLNCGLGASVDIDKCTACLSCLRVCPYGVPVVEERAAITAEGCQACGACAAACPAGAISVGIIDEGASLRALDTVSLDGSLVVFACRGSCIKSPRLAGLAQEAGLGRVRLLEIPTTGALRLEWVLKAFERGAQGVAVVACGDGECRYSGGPAPLEGLIGRARALLAGAGLDAGRLLYCRPEPGEDPVSLLTGFANFIHEKKDF